MNLLTSGRLKPTDCGRVVLQAEAEAAQEAALQAAQIIQQHQDRETRC